MEGTNRELLRQIVLGSNIADKLNNNGGILCSVVSVDSDKFTCKVKKIDNPDIEFEDVKLSVNDKGMNVIIPEIDSIVIISPFQGSYFISMFSEIKQYYQATNDESILEILNDLLDAIIAIQLLHPQGSTVANGVINISSFQDVKQRLQKFYLK
jgi:hypothetical protein